MVLYDMHKKGFIDMVKGLLAWFIRVLRSSGPSPSTPSTSSTNVETIIISNTTRQNKCALKKYGFDFYGTSLVI